MKTGIIKLLAFVLPVSIAIQAKAQMPDDFLQLGTHEVQSTARFTGLGGAFNALGGDIGSLSTNPAGIGVYRSSEFSITPALTFNNTSTNFLERSTDDSRTRFGMPSLGYVSNWLSGNASGLITLNFGFAINRTANFYKNTKFTGLNSPNSVADFYAKHATSFNPDYIIKNVEDNKYNQILPNDWSTALAYDTYLLEYDNANNKFHTPGLDLNDRVDISGKTQQSGGTQEYAFSLGGNISNKVQFGFTIGLQDVYLSNHLYYREQDIVTNQGNFIGNTRNEYTTTTGFGANFKAGLIFRPVDAFRLGFAVHTPTFFNMNREYRVDMASVFFEANSQEKTYNKALDPDMYEYSLNTPYRLEAGLAYIIGKIGLISVDYEFVGNSSMRMRDNYGGTIPDTYNDLIKQSYRSTSNVRVGAELNLPYGVVLRGGYNYFQSPYKDSKLDFARNAYSGGIGFRNKTFFADFAFVMNTGKYYYAPYYVNDYRIRDSDGNTNHAVEQSNISRVVVTLGFKFK
ncbi:MAG: outer membrane protein transport protein [Prevotellaceae bacterium]|jgi:hypothetical protein|nr:outer membrane protein transport protein [Prevotellaceae bacterium]